MAGESYEGWTNLATHRVNLWVMNDYDSYMMYERANDREWNAKLVEKFVGEIPAQVLSGIRNDIRTGGQKWSDINWTELAETWNEE